MTGVNTFIFWGTSFLWDLLIIFFAILVIVLCFPIFQTDGAYTANDGLCKDTSVILNQVYCFPF